MVERGVYRHYKGGLYEVLGNAVRTETGEKFVIYRPVGVISKILAISECIWNEKIDAQRRRFEREW